MKNELVDEFIDESKNSSINKLGFSKVLDVQECIGEKFNIDTSHTWCWESIGIPYTNIPYGKEDGLKEITRIVNQQSVLLIITDETKPPWYGFKGEIIEIIEVIRNLRYFEFFIIDEDCTWIIFDTHHNSLVIAGELPLIK